MKISGFKAAKEETAGVGAVWINHKFTASLVLPRYSRLFLEQEFRRKIVYYGEASIVRGSVPELPASYL